MLFRSSTLNISLPILEPTGLERLEHCLEDLLWPSGVEKQYDIHRTKGLLRMTDGSTKMVQGVREIFEITEAKSTSDIDQESTSRIVLIGRNLDTVPPRIGWQE